MWFFVVGLKGNILRNHHFQNQTITVTVFWNVPNTQLCNLDVGASLQLNLLLAQCYQIQPCEDL